MKQIIILTILLTTVQLIKSQELTMNTSLGSVSANSKTLVWKNQNVDLGKIEFDKPVKVAFEFTNTSNEPLVIKNVKTTCGCTVAKYDNMVVKPGASSKIEVTYNAKSKGFFNKTVEVFTSLNSIGEKITMQGTVN